MPEAPRKEAEGARERARDERAEIHTVAEDDAAFNLVKLAILSMFRPRSVISFE